MLEVFLVDDVVRSCAHPSEGTGWSIELVFKDLRVEVFSGSSPDCGKRGTGFRVSWWDTLIPVHCPLLKIVC